MKLTIYFDNDFWYGLIEYTDTKENYRVIRHLFGKEPKDPEIFLFVNKVLPRLILKNNKLAKDQNNFSSYKAKEKKTNPKRMQREINRAKRKPIVSTKAQLELQKTHELLKKEKRKQSKRNKDLAKEYKFKLKQEKKLKKHKGH